MYLDNLNTDFQEHNYLLHSDTFTADKQIFI